MPEFKILRFLLVCILLLTGLFIFSSQNISAANAPWIEDPLILSKDFGTPGEIYPVFQWVAVSQADSDEFLAVAHHIIIMPTVTLHISTPPEVTVTPLPTPDKQGERTIRLFFLLVGGLVVLTVVMILVVVMVLKKLKNLA